MSIWSRIANVFRGERVSREIEEELSSHIEEAMAAGRDAGEARRAFGSSRRVLDETRDRRVVAWLDSLRADTVFGWRQIRRKKVNSAVAVLSLGLAMGACTSAFRLIDAVLLRPLPVSHPERLYAISFEGTDSKGKPRSWDSNSYPMFRQWRNEVGGQAELIAVSQTERADLSYGSDEATEKAYRQFVSGWMFEDFGLKPALGRLLSANDDRQPGAAAVAVLSYDYWARRFGRDRAAVGRTFRMGNRIYEIVGVAEEGFSGTEPGAMTDVFLPTMMRTASIGSPNSFWLRVLVRLAPGARVEPLRERLAASYAAFEFDRLKGQPKYQAGIAKDRVLLEPAAAGVSGMQKHYRRSLMAIAILVALVLLIACANVANLMTAQAAARAREMALRVSIGAGRRRLIQMVLVEGALLSALAAAAGALLAWWAAPVVVGMINPPDNPARLDLPADWRVLGFGIGLTTAVTFLFGLAPALRASAVKPAAALKGGEDPHARRRLMHALVACQSAFCFLVLFAAGLFAGTFTRLAELPMGFSAERLLAVETVTPGSQPAAYWEQAASRLRSIAGVESTGISAWPLMTGEQRNNRVSVNGAPPSDALAFFLAVSPGWAGTMKIPLLAGRDFLPTDVYPEAAIVNAEFARRFFDGANPVGKVFESPEAKGAHFQIVGLAGNARYRSMREEMLPVIYVPFASAPVSRATFMVRTASSNPMALAAAVRAEVARGGVGFRASNIRTQVEIDDAQTVRERLLALLGAFFAGVALLLAGIGMYGVLDYSVQQRGREIGIRRAIGAKGGDIAWRVTSDVLAMMAAGALAGLGIGVFSVRYIEPLFFGVKGSDAGALALPTLMICVAALVAAAPAVVRAVRIDPVKMLRSE